MKLTPAIKQIIWKLSMSKPLPRIKPAHVRDKGKAWTEMKKTADWHTKRR